MLKTTIHAVTVLLLTCLVAGCDRQAAAPDTGVAQGDATDARVAALESRLAALKARARRIRDSNDIKRLQRAYGYYLDEGLWDEMVDLFTDDATVEYARDGLYRGKDRIRQYLYRLGNNHQGLAEGQLNEHFQLMPVVTLADDGMTAKGRWRALILNGQLGEYANWGEGPYENEYRKEDGVWKISKVHWYQTIMVPYDGAWGLNEDVNQGIYVSPDFPPDAPPTEDYGSWPTTFLPPFHFDNPVGKYVPAADQGGEG